MAGLRENIGDDINIVILEESTSSQPETVYRAIKKLNIDEPFMVKDSDNTFEINVIADQNYICYSSLDEYEEINARNKSYILMNEQEIILRMAEKKIISQTFNVGGYFFKDTKKFIECYEKLVDDAVGGELYLSHIIEEMRVNNNEVFIGKKVQNYFDWGTFRDWQKYRKKFHVYIFDLDGVFFRNGAQYHEPRWENIVFIEENIKKLIELSNDRYAQLYFLTARTEKYRNMIEEKFKEKGIRHSGLLMGCMHAKRTIINDFSKTTGYPSCDAISIPRDSDELNKYL